MTEIDVAKFITFPGGYDTLAREELSTVRGQDLQDLDGMNKILFILSNKLHLGGASGLLRHILRSSQSGFSRD